MHTTAFIKGMFIRLAPFLTGAIVSAQTPTPTPTPPLPTPFPTLFAPVQIDTTVTLPGIWGQLHRVDSGQILQTVVDQAKPGDRIVLDLDVLTESVTIEKGPLLIESAPGRRSAWTGPLRLIPNSLPPQQIYQAHPALILQNAPGIVLRRINLAGANGFSWNTQYWMFVGQGGSGAPAVDVTDSTVTLIDVRLSGGSGGAGGTDDNFHSSNGGDASSAARGLGTAFIQADPLTTFTGGGAGDVVFVSFPTPHPPPSYGNPAQPVELAPGTELKWFNFSGLPQSEVPVELSSFEVE